MAARQLPAQWRSLTGPVSKYSRQGALVVSIAASDTSLASCDENCNTYGQETLLDELRQSHADPNNSNRGPPRS